MSLIVRAMADSDWSSLADMFEQPVFRWWTLRMPYQSINDIKKLVESRNASGLSLVAEQDGMVVGMRHALSFSGAKAARSGFLDGGCRQSSSPGHR